MTPNNGGQSSSDLQRRAAANIARRKVLEAYTKSAVRPLSTGNGTQNAQAPLSQNITDRTHLKSTATAPQIDVKPLGLN